MMSIPGTKSWMRCGEVVCTFSFSIGATESRGFIRVGLLHDGGADYRLGDFLFKMELGWMGGKEYNNGFSRIMSARLRFGGDGACDSRRDMEGHSDD